jgi:hypothetical protein
VGDTDGVVVVLYERLGACGEAAGPRADKEKARAALVCE